MNQKHQMGQAVSQTLNDFDGLMIDGELTDQAGQFQVNFMSAEGEQQLSEGLSRLEDEARQRGFYELKIHPEALEDFNTPEESAGFLSMAGYKYDGENYFKDLQDRPVVEPAPAPVVKPKPEPVVEPAPAPATGSSLADRNIPADQITEENYDGSVPVPEHLTKKYQELIPDLKNPNGGEKAAVDFGSLLSKRAENLAGFNVAEEAERVQVETELLRDKTRQGIIAVSGSASERQVDNHVEMIAGTLNKVDAKLRANNSKLRDAYQQTLSEVRPMGGNAKTGKRSQKKATEYLNQATQYFPSEWVNRSNNHGFPLVPKMSSRRAHYIPIRGTSDGFVANLTINEMGSYVDGQSGAVAVATHEFTHRMENVVPGLYDLEKQFRDRRTTMNNGRLEPLVGIRSPGSRERARVDHFTSRYMGRVYNFDGYTEIMSTGTQALFGGDYGGLTGMGRGANADHDMRNFVLGALGGHTVRE
ncbi:hypothetical protein [Glutamicibacter ardleyensis]|uniref:hypothetical protein n=1 Tax=Glutamicibacter ardleyensis TaxID=225894 RepID=UPI003FD23DA0